MGAVLSPPPEKEVLRSWLPPKQLRKEVTELLPDNLVPMLDPCLAKFYLSPIDVADPNYCVYFDNAEFQVRLFLARGGDYYYVVCKIDPIAHTAVCSCEVGITTQPKPPSLETL